MKPSFIEAVIACAVALGALLIAPLTHAEENEAQVTLARCLARDPWGMSGAVVKAEIVLTDKRKATRTLAFDAVSQQIAKGLAKSIVRFSAPSELKGAGFLQVQKPGADDDRFLFLPELARARRISGNLRKTSFMGTDFSFADLDRRDLREGTAVASGEHSAGGLPCSGLKVTPGRKDSEYSLVELCVGKDNNLPLDMKMYDHSGSVLKAFVAQKIEKIEQQWFITRSTMTNLKHNHATQLTLKSVKVVNNVDDSKFTVRELERI